MVAPNARHESVTLLMRYFEFSHLPDGVLRETSQRCYELAWDMYNDIKLSGPELTVGLRKLLEAKDCFVRSALD